VKRKSAPAGVIVLVLLAFWMIKSHQQVSPQTASPAGSNSGPAVVVSLPGDGSRLAGENRERRSGLRAGLHESAPYQVSGARVTDINTGRAIDIPVVDLRPTVERIAAGEKNPHRNDGSVFRNASRKLPNKPSGYYREYVVPTEGIRGPGPQRLIIGKEGETYYTPDHYETFIEIQGDR
jgi:guanyl-specific ribonuclease Sa